MADEMTLVRLQALVTPELIGKIKQFYDSGDEGKKNLANANIDKMLRAYLQDCKYENGCKSLLTAELWLKTALQNEKDKGCENWIMQVLLDKFVEYRGLKEKHKLIDDQKEKDRIASILKSRNLWEI